VWLEFGFGRQVLHECLVDDAAVVAVGEVAGAQLRDEKRGREHGDPVPVDDVQPLHSMRP
jgi:hypothetical protein